MINTEKEFYGSCHTHLDSSNYRLRDCIIKLEPLCEYALELGHNFVAITDHETVSSFLHCQEVEEEIRKKHPDFKIIKGNEIYLCRNGLNKENYKRGEDRFWHFILLAKDEVGVKQLYELSTRAWMRSFKQGKMIRVPTYYQDLKDIIGENKGHIIGLTACLGSFIATKSVMYYNNPDENLYNNLLLWVNNMRNIFGKDDFFLEVQPANSKEQKAVYHVYKKISEELKIPVIISLDAHYLKKEDIGIHHAFLTAQEGERETEEFYATTYMMSREEIHGYMDNEIGTSLVSEWMNNTRIIYDKCKYYNLKKPLHIPYLPKTINKITEKQFLEYKNRIKELEYFYVSNHQEDRDLAAAIITKIYEDKDQYDNEKTYEAIDDNLKAIRLASEKMNTCWSAYLLNMRDYIKIIWEKGNSLVAPSRGSGCGFLLLNMLNITQINPLREKTKTYSFRFLNPERVSVLDIDCDIEGGKRPQVYEALQEAYGKDRVSKVLTIKTEKARSALQTAARGLGYPPEVGADLSRFIKADRGLQRTLKQTFYGDEENNIPPDKTFQDMMTNKYPDIWKVAQYIEGMVNGVGSHAGGIIFYDEPITNTTALMKTSSGDVITQYDLHKLEEVSLIKIDLLSIEALDRIRACLDLLTEYNYLDKKLSLRERYEQAIGVYNLERNAPEMWEMIYNHKVESLFQMEEQSGIKGIAVAKPTSVDDLAALNAAIRLMPPEGVKETPIDKFARFKNNINEWYKELEEWKVDKKYWKLLKNIVGITYGMCIQQEQFMILVQQPEIGGFSLLWSDKLRKSIAKKNPKAFEELEKEFYKTIKEKQCDYNLCNYVWKVLISVNKGYGFNAAHTLGYSILGLQEMNLAYKYPIIFWNTANLIVDSGSMNLSQKFNEEDLENSGCDYGKIATAVGKMKKAGISFNLPNINKSNITYSPDLKEETIISGFRGTNRIGNQLIYDIIKNRPYTSIDDFLSKVKVNVVQMISLIKSGAFDCICDNNREKAMDNYINSICGKKSVINLRNMNMLIEMNLIPKEYDFYRKLYNYNNYLKTLSKGNNFILNKRAIDFYLTNFDEEFLVNLVLDGENSSATLDKKTWKKIYDKKMLAFKNYLKENQDEILAAVNTKLYNDYHDKYAKGTISKWEMDSVGFYFHPHELQNLQNDRYNISNFFNLPEQPEIDSKWITKNGKEITTYKLRRIAGTIIDKNKDKSTITILTTDGVVKVKIWKNQFPVWDRRIISIDKKGDKHILEESWFTRGNKLIITGIRRDDTFVPKVYKKTPYPLFQRIDKLSDDGEILESAIERVETDI